MRPQKESCQPQFFHVVRLALLASAMAFSGCGRAPHSSPTVLRDTNAYYKAIAPQKPGALNSKSLDQVTVQLEGQTLVATMPFSETTAEALNDGFDHVVKHLKPGEWLEGNDARFELIAFAATVPGLPKGTANKYGSFPLDFFAPDGKPLTREQLKSLGFRDWELTDYERADADPFPKLRLIFGSSKQPPGYYSAVGVFDSRTKINLTSGYSWSEIGKGNLGRMEIRPRAWHATPMEAIVDVELDGKVTVETNVVPDTKVRVPGGEVKLLGIWDGGSSSWSSSGGSQSSPMELRIPLNQSQGETNCVALFITEPPKLAVHVQLLDQQGKELAGNGGGACGAIRVMGLHGRASDAKRARFTVFTNHQEVVITLPPIPNLPATNRATENLFDVVIPSARIESEYKLGNLIGDTTQFRLVNMSSGNVMPGSLFPMVRTNVTPAQLLAEYQQYLTNTLMIVVDEQKQEIRVEPTLIEKIKQWLNQRL